jgi:hypothetical protein
MKTPVCILFLSMLLVSRIASATPSAPDVESMVKTSFLTPLAKREAVRSRYSRVAVPPAQRRVQISEAPAKDADGKSFVAFTIDERRYGKWTKGALSGCAYTDSGAIYVKRGDKLRSADAYLGKSTDKAPASACIAANADESEARSEPLHG